MLLMDALLNVSGELSGAIASERFRADVHGAHVVNLSRCRQR